jgi:hypothetical protein
MRAATAVMVEHDRECVATAAEILCLPLPTAADASKPATLDWGGLVNALHVRPGVVVTFDALTTRGFASPYSPAAQQLSQAVFGQASWPTFTSEPGASALCTPAPAVITSVADQD